MNKLKILRETKKSIVDEKSTSIRDFILKSLKYRVSWKKFRGSVWGLSGRKAQSPHTLE